MSAIITTGDLETYTGNTDLLEGRASLIVAAVNDYIGSSTGRSWGATTTYTETYSYGSTVWLRQADVQTITSVKLGYNGNQYTIPSDAYFFNSSGRLTFSTGLYSSPYYNSFNPARDYVTITYTAGTASVPNDLKLAALELAADFYDYAENGDQQVSMEMIGGYKVMYSDQGRTDASSRVASILGRYRQRTL